MEYIHNHVFFAGKNFKLEGVLSSPKEESSRPGVIICHPHPAYGGDMNNNVVLGIKEALEKEGFVILRFNFRGVNLSEGSYGEGKGEIEDVIAALSFMKIQPRVDNNRLFLSGYSFGAWVGLKAALNVKDLKAVAGISPPFGMFNFEFLENISIPIFLMGGDQDNFCSLEEFERIFNKISSPKKRIILPRADHFYWGREEEVGEKVREFFCCYL